MAARCHHDTPDNTGKTPDQKPKGLNNKLKAGLKTQRGQLAGSSGIALARTTLA